MKEKFTLIFFIILGLNVFSQSNQNLHFDGVDDYVLVYNLASEIDGSNQLSMTGWFKVDELRYGAGMIGFRGGGTGDTMYLLELGNGKIECRMFINGTMYEVQAPDGSMQANVWQHMAMVYDGSNVKLYIDGNLIGSHAASGTFSLVDKPFGIGKSILAGYNFVYNGSIDEVTLWKKALTQTEIQNMIANELTGNEQDLVLYYKFNQGIPEDDNTFITELLTETSNGYNGELYNFALTGNTSNFIGTLEPGFQSINFPTVPNKVTTDPPFTLNAYSSSGLPVSYTLVSGPASISGNTVTLNGTPGEVVIKASQSGDATYAPAQDVYAHIQVFDPNTVLPEVTLANPIVGSDVLVPQLNPIPIALTVSIDHPDTFSVASVSLNINGDNVALTNHDDTHYTGWWTPNSYGVQNVTIEATNNYGATQTTTDSFTIVNTGNNTTVSAGSNILLNSTYNTKEVTVELPTSVGGYDQVLATLHIDCPSGGCDPWDRVSHVEVKGKDGEWHEIIRYVTPYGVACDHQVDLTDFISLLQGKTTFRYTLGTYGNGYLYSMDLTYNTGSPNYLYSTVDYLWHNTYPFGDMANLQPCEYVSVNYDQNTETARLKLVSTGHGWGDNNTGNAAEFHHDTHTVWVNGRAAFSQDNWLDCNPNPDGCQPQNGTWIYDRAGWCPGAIAPWFDFDFSNIDYANSMTLNYILNPNYVDYCHPHNPDCVSGQTCPDCSAGFNPHLIVASHLICYSNTPIDHPQITLVDPNGIPEIIESNVNLYPNPNWGKFFINTDEQIDKIEIYKLDGALIKSIDIETPKEKYDIDISGAKPGVYLAKMYKGKAFMTRRFIVK